MKQQITETHTTDENGNPTGGETTGTGIAIRWQSGPLGRDEHRQAPNGAFVEGVIQAEAMSSPASEPAGGGDEQ